MRDRQVGVLLAVLGAMLAGAIPVERAAADIELKNDGFMPGSQVQFFFGTNYVGEIAAGRFTAPGPGHRLLGLKVMWGGAQTLSIITLRIWDDPGGPGNAPGAEVFRGDFQLQAINSPIFAEVPLAGAMITLPAQFRLGIESHQAGAPRVGVDTDGTLAGDRNYLFAVPGGWIRSQVFAGVTGDWVLRPVISDTGSGGPVDAGVDASGGPDAGVGPDGGEVPDAGTGAACTTNVECAVGQYCDPDLHRCTLECRQSADCGGGATCNSFGQCVNGGGGGCRTSGGGAEEPLALVGILGLLVARRRCARARGRSLSRSR